MANGDPGFDLDAYLHRIGVTGRPAADVTSLREVHRAHLTAIPFENIDPVLGRVPSLAEADLLAKLVHSGRGGYCYEHNTLLGAALGALGFGVRRLTARVVVGAERHETRPRTHMALLVDVPGDRRRHLADVGFGAPGALVEPLPFVADAVRTAAGRSHRLTRTRGTGPLDLWALDARGAAGWETQYVFTEEPFERSDIEVVNWHIATHPRSPFRSRLRICRTGPDGSVAVLNGTTLTRTPPGASGTVREVLGRDELHRVLHEEFGITAPEDLTAAVRPAEPAG
ncbi:arylamine N-acetyltransferase [Streptomyces sulfonofaciens]|uniref:Arylamine N-acetyltransferase n=1 Tax=Streptomyces sulfonofaciens TaxID=68272 RepID=A0A919FZL7_9ACTN|nr:arylamine N-acetyltransferase [Streptomyces sulfonofaciens]GHH74535.1 arylamine N-acetyltransferase [Streptomyces sulfonofaciens]